MLTKKIDDELVTGTQGVVRAFLAPAEYSAARQNGDLQDIVDGAAPPARTGNFLAKRYPVVLFNVGAGASRWVLCSQKPFELEYLRQGGIETAVRVQIPLTLSWAMSIHRAQGQSLDHVRIDLQGIFTEGQTYTAISRGRTQYGIQLVNFSSAAVRTDSNALSYVNGIPTAENLLKPAKISDWFDPPHLAERVRKG